MYRNNISMSERFWMLLPAFIAAGILFIVVRVLMIYIVMFNIAVQGLNYAN